MKLPKEMQKKEANKPKRPQMVKQREGNQQVGSRQMRRKMAQQGIDMDQIEATRVIIEGPEKTLIIEQPEVVLMKQAGQEIYQVVGTATETNATSVSLSSTQATESLEPSQEVEVKLTITENDIMLVAAQANVDPKEAEAVLRNCEGDIAKAILYLKNKPS